MRATFLAAILLFATASCSQQAGSQPPSNFDRDAAEARIKEADFRYSLGLLLAKPQPHNPAFLRNRLDQALETRFSDQTNTDESFVIGEEHFHFVSIGGTLVRFDSFPTPYFPPEEEFADEEIRQAVEQHTAWIAVDVQRHEGGPTEAGAYRLAGRLIEGLADEENTLAIFSASDMTIATWDEDFRESLRGPNPRSIFGQLAGEIGIHEPDDPEMQEAIDIARRRFPEFRQAFARRGRSAAPFLVLLPFQHAQGIERMWVEVRAIDDESISGTLANEPYYVEDLARGAPVTAPIGNIIDWMYRTGRTPVGGFTMAVIARRQQQGESEPE